MTLRISATDIDSYRRFRGDEEDDLATFLARLRKWEPPTPAMKAGTALHKALENATPGQYLTLEADGYTFEIRGTNALDLPDIRECKATREYEIGGLTVTVVGKVDAVHGNRIDDHKFTGRFDAERFLDSYQWRIYLEVFGADEFRWNVFEGTEVGDKQYVISAVHPLRTFRYPGIGADVERELGLFTEFAKAHLPERIKEAA